MKMPALKTGQEKRGSVSNRIKYAFYGINSGKEDRQ